MMQKRGLKLSVNLELEQGAVCMWLPKAHARPSTLSRTGSRLISCFTQRPLSPLATSLAPLETTRKRKRKKPYVPIAERVALKREKLAAAALVQSQKQSQKQRQKQSQKQSQTQTQSQTQSQTQAKHGRQGEATESLQSHGPYVGQAAGRDTAQPSQQTTVGLGSDTSRIAAKGQKKKRRRSSVKPETISLKSVDKGKDREGGRHSEGQKPNTAVRVKLHVQPDPKVTRSSRCRRGDHVSPRLGLCILLGAGRSRQ